MRNSAPFISLDPRLFNWTIGTVTLPRLLPRHASCWIDSKCTYIPTWCDVRHASALMSPPSLRNTYHHARITLQKTWQWRSFSWLKLLSHVAQHFVYADILVTTTTTMMETMPIMESHFVRIAPDLSIPKGRRVKQPAGTLTGGSGQRKKPHVPAEIGGWRWCCWLSLWTIMTSARCDAMSDDENGPMLMVCYYC